MVCAAARGPATAPGSAAFGGGRLRVDEARHEASFDGDRLDLTPTGTTITIRVPQLPRRS
jgi:two-component system alkaline phosphatase synthesis response regulator PhoP